MGEHFSEENDQEIIKISVQLHIENVRNGIYLNKDHDVVSWNRNKQRKKELCK